CAACRFCAIEGFFRISEFSVQVTFFVNQCHFNILLLPCYCIHPVLVLIKLSFLPVLNLRCKPCTGPFPKFNLSWKFSSACHLIEMGSFQACFCEDFI